MYERAALPNRASDEADGTGGRGARQTGVNHNQRPFGTVPARPEVPGTGAQQTSCCGDRLLRRPLGSADTNAPKNLIFRNILPANSVSTGSFQPTGVFCDQAVFVAQE